MFTLSKDVAQVYFVQNQSFEDLDTCEVGSFYRPPALVISSSRLISDTDRHFISHWDFDKRLIFQSQTQVFGFVMRERRSEY